MNYTPTMYLHYTYKVIPRYINVLLLKYYYDIPQKLKPMVKKRRRIWNHRPTYI